MSFVRSSTRRPSGLRTGTIVHAVGQRVYVARSGDGSARVNLMDDGGTTALAELVDGAEVMVVGWRPRGASGTRYCVRCTGDGREGWLAAANLRSARTVTPSPVESVPGAKSAAPSPPSGSRDSKPRFGQR